MKNRIFFLRFGLLSLLIALLIIFLEHSASEKKVLLNDIWLFYVFFLLTTLLAYKIALWGIQKGGEAAIFFILGSVVVKFLLSAIFALVYIYLNRVNSQLFILNFFILYFVYTVFEIYSLMSNLRAQKK